MDLKDLSRGNVNTERLAAGSFISSCSGLSNPYTTSTNPITDLHFDTKNPGLATYFRFSFRFFKKGSCQLLAKVCARSTG